jgi:hypothetical protein
MPSTRQGSGRPGSSRCAHEVGPRDQADVHRPCPAAAGHPYRRPTEPRARRRPARRCPLTGQVHDASCSTLLDAPGARSAGHRALRRAPVGHLVGSDGPSGRARETPWSFAMAVPGGRQHVSVPGEARARTEGGGPGRDPSFGQIDGRSGGKQRWCRPRAGVHRCSHATGARRGALHCRRHRLGMDGARNAGYGRGAVDEFGKPWLVPRSLDRHDAGDDVPVDRADHGRPRRSACPSRSPSAPLQP